MDLLFPDETVRDFLVRPGLYRRLRYRLRLELQRRRRDGSAPEWRVLPLLVDPARAALDVGANYGFYAGVLCRLARRVHCFEPIAPLAEQLRVRLPPWAVVHAVALSDHEGEARLVLPVGTHGRGVEAGASLVSDHLRVAGWRAVEHQPCRTARLDDLLAEPVGFIKIDVVGHERATLAGARAILARDRPALMVEALRHLRAEAPFDVAADLRMLGYRCLFLFEGRLHAFERFVPDRHQPLSPEGEPVEPYAWNFVFLPAE